MAEQVVTPETFQFTQINYHFNSNREKGPFHMKITLQAKFGCHKDPTVKRGIVELIFSAVDDGKDLSLEGAAEAFFDLNYLSGPVDNDVVEQLCFRPAYEEFRKRIEAMGTQFGGAPKIKFVPFEQLPDNEQ